MKAFSIATFFIGKVLAAEAQPKTCIADGTCASPEGESLDAQILSQTGNSDDNILLQQKVQISADSLKTGDSALSTSPLAGETLAKFEQQEDKKALYYQMEKGTCCCPPEKRITTRADCEKAHDALGLHRNKPWSGNHGGIPGGCSTRQDRSSDLHWNGRVPGMGRKDLTAICRGQALLATTTTTTRLDVPMVLHNRSALDAQFLMQASFGPTVASMQELSGMSYIQWIKNQMALPVESHRAYYRARVNPQFEENNTRIAVANLGFAPMRRRWGGMASGPALFSAVGACKKGSRWSGSAFTRADLDSKFEVKNGQIFVAGQWRSDIDSSATAPNCTNNADVRQSGQACTQYPTKSRRRYHTTIMGKCDEWKKKPLADGTKTCQQACYDAGSGYPGDVCTNWKNEPLAGYICNVENMVNGYIMIGVPSCWESKVKQYLPNPPIYIKDTSGVVKTSASFDRSAAVPNAIFFAGGACDFDGSTKIQVSNKYYTLDPRLELQENTIDNPLSSDRRSCVAKSFLNAHGCKVQPKSAGCGVACGSPGEIANVPEEGHQYAFSPSAWGTPAHCPRDKGPKCLSSDFKGAPPKVFTFLFDNKGGPFGYGNTYAAKLCKSTVWTMTAFQAKDQLRQRVAWSMAQIIVVSAGGLGFWPSWATEQYLNFYDIFMRNAFGSFRNVLQEVTYSPLMAKYLTYFKSKCYDYTGKFADENYAREIMQLFTVGIDLLHPNGTVVKDNDGTEVAAYTNENIMSFARVLTGFRPVAPRGNHEQNAKAWNDHNMIDPMTMEPDWHDVYPKPDITGGYLGDGYPLCADLPKFGFLAKGAKYEFLGYQYIEHTFHKKGTDSAPGVAFEPEAASSLYSLLCSSGTSDSGGSGECTFALTVTLENDLDCHGKECNWESLDVVKIGDGYYEYVAPTCVHSFFYNGQLVVQNGAGSKTMCVDPNAPMASVACSKDLKLPPLQNLGGEGCQSNKQCGSCQGDCDRDDDCGPGLKCFMRNAFEQVPGCAVGGPGDEVSGMDFCYNVSKVSPTALQNLGGSGCQPNKQCQACQGDCDRDSDCASGLKCFQRRAFEQVPGCDVGGPGDTVKGLDFCYKPRPTDLQNLGGSGCKPHKQCQACQGDCDRDADCAPGLKCFQRNAFEQVTGCHVGGGGDRRSYDFCYDPTAPPVATTTTTTPAPFEVKLYCDSPQERVSYSTAQSVCKKAGMDLNAWPTGPCGYQADFWMENLCSIEVKVYDDGKVSAHTLHAENKFQVFWTGPPAQAGDYKATVVTTTLFTSVPSKEDVKARATIGAFPPHAACTVCDGEVKVYPGKATAPLLDEHTIFEVAGRFFKNVESIVQVGGSSFRNPPSFMRPSGGNHVPNVDSKISRRRAALAEVESLIDNLFHHPNTPVNFAKKMIQRLVTSNPAPAYLQAAVRAFSSGTYDGETFTGKYGDLGAMATAILLHPDARTQAVAADGLLREPMLKIMHFLRAMEYKDNTNSPIVLEKNEDELGQFPWYSPTVFNFFSADFSPGDSFGKKMKKPASEPEPEPEPVVAPEFQIYTPPRAIFLLNGFHELVKNGMSGCADGLGLRRYFKLPTESCAEGTFGYKGLASPDATIEELNILLTGGRMTPESIETAKNALADKDGLHSELSSSVQSTHLQAAQTAILLEPEFNTLGLTQSSEADSETASDVVESPTDYKAMVLVFLAGGADTYNMLVPRDCALHDEYAKTRAGMELKIGDLNPIAAPNQKCTNFGITKAMPNLFKLYDMKEAAFISNIGLLLEPTSRSGLKGGASRGCPSSFSHYHATIGAQACQCAGSRKSSAGVGGAIADALGKKQMNVASFSVAGTATWSAGIQTGQEILSESRGAPTMTDYNAWENTIKEITGETHTNMYCDEYAKAFKKAVMGNQHLAAILKNASSSTLKQYKKDSGLAKQLNQVSRIIATRQERKAERDFFFVQKGGWDMHKGLHTMGTGLGDSLAQVDSAIAGFVNEMKSQGIFESVVVATESDFGRTMTYNGAGTDHGWGGNHFIVGGGIKGGEVYNDFLETFELESEWDAGRGRIVPKYPWENMMVPIAEWMGVDHIDIPAIFPNLGNFNRSEHIIARDDLFWGTGAERRRRSGGLGGVGDSGGSGALSSGSA